MDKMNILIPVGVMVAWFGGLLSIEWISPLLMIIGFLIIAVPYNMMEKK